MFVNWVRNNRRITVIAIAAAVAILAGLLVPIPNQHRAFGAIWDLVHTPLFCGVTLGVLYLLEMIVPTGIPSRKRLARLMIVVTGVFAFGLATEFAQSLLGRRATMHDAVANGLGILAAAALYLSYWHKRQQPDKRAPRRVLIAIGFLLILCAWLHPAVRLVDMAKVHLDYPLLGSFESNAELERWYMRECKARITDRDATDGHYAMEVTYLPTAYPAATLTDLHTDWSDMKSLELDVTLDSTSPSQRVQLVIKVIDELHHNHSDTFRKQFTLVAGETTHLRMMRDEIVAGPGTRELDLSRIQYVDLLLLELDAETVIRIDSLRLTL